MGIATKNLIITLKKLGFKSKFFTDTPYKYSTKEPVRRVLWLEEIKMWLREDHNVMISIYTNASGYLWNKMDSIGGTDRGWSQYDGPNDSGCWDDYPDALEAAIIKACSSMENQGQKN